LMHHYKADRQPSEGFGDYCTRLGKPALLSLLG
jgi:hypothetical protein